MKHISEMTQKGDPMIRTQLPGILLRMLQNDAKKNKRRIQDQFIKSLADTFRNEESYSEIFDSLLPDVKKTYQIE